MLLRHMMQRGLQEALHLLVALVRVLKLRVQGASARRCASPVRCMMIGPIPILRELRLEDLFFDLHRGVVGSARLPSARRCLTARLRQRRLHDVWRRKCLRELFCKLAYKRRERSTQGHVQRKTHGEVCRLDSTPPAAS